jgi:ABC-type uncharacterized transport system YnjBCD ATPase subunit
VAGIRKSFDGKTVIDNLNLTINNGEFLTLLGPSVLRIPARCTSGERERGCIFNF